MTDRTPQELKALRGYNRAQAFTTKKMSFTTSQKTLLLEDIPESLDWRDSGAVQKVKDQMSCGSCWAFSTAAVIESHLFITQKKLFSLSEQQLVACVQNPDHCGGTGGCEGATQELGFAYAAGAGVTTEDSWPYEGTDTTCDTSKIKSCNHRRLC